MSINKFIFSFLLSLIILFGAGYGVYLYQIARNAEEPVVYYNVADKLIKIDDNFAEGERLLRERQFATSRGYFERALQEAENDIERGQIEYKIAFARAQEEGGIADAIQLFKKLVAKETYNTETKAYSIQFMGQLFYLMGNPEVTKLIFSDEPYKTFIKEGDVELAYRRLFEYGSSFYPLAIMELRIAEWYGTAIGDIYTAGHQDKRAEDVAAYTAIIKEKIASANKNIKEIQNDENNRLFYPEALLRKAIIISRAYSLFKDPAYNPENLYKKILDLAKTDNNKALDGFARYYYAHYVAYNFPDRKQDVKNILSAFYDGSIDFEGTTLKSFFINERNNTLGGREPLLMLAGIDPKFKEFLKTLGWTF